jgi:quercetin dioxygenase-like cupin family protein
VPLWNDRPDAWHEVLPGVRRRVLADHPNSMLLLYRIRPGATVPEHSHPHVQSGVLLEGAAEFRVGSEVWALRPGSSYTIPSGVSHALRAAEGPECLILDAFVPRRDDFAAEVLPPDRP